jgi:hypothetical protein
MTGSLRLLLSAGLALGLVAEGRAASDATLFRLFLTDGTVVVSYGEFVRVDDRVIFSMPAGGSVDDPRLQVVTLEAALIDWPRTDRYAASARYQRYAETRGEEDFQLLSNEVARVLNDIALSTDRQRALEIAEQARRTLAEWPRAHYGYRQDDVREIVGLLDEAINSLRGQAGRTSFELSLVATAPVAELEPVYGMPSPAEQLDQLLHLAGVMDRASERVALLQSAAALVVESGAAIGSVDTAGLRRFIEARIGEEAAIDARYARLSQRLMANARRAAAQARVADVERVLNQIAREDARLGNRRPEVIQSLHSSLQQELDAARRLRLRRDQWVVRRSLYRAYQRDVGTYILQLAKAEPWLEAIRRLDGPAPSTLLTLRGRLDGGTERLDRLFVPDELRTTHELLIGAWRFAQNAVNVRYDAVVAANVGAAWEASSAAAGALMLFARVQEEIRTFLEPPTLENESPP